MRSLKIVRVGTDRTGDKGVPVMKTYLCVMDVLPSGHIAAMEIRAEDAISAERDASAAGRARFGGPVEILEVVRTDVTPAA